MKCFVVTSDTWTKKDGGICSKSVVVYKGRFGMKTFDVWEQMRPLCLYDVDIDFEGKISGYTFVSDDFEEVKKFYAGFSD